MAETEKPTLWRNIAHYAIEFVIVLVGIYLALSLENAAQQRDEARRAADHLESLSDDIAADREALDAVIAFAVDKRRELGELLETFSTGNATADDAMRAGTLISGYSFFEPEQFTLLSMRESGEFRLIGDPELRTGILRLNELYDRIESAQDNYLQALDDLFIPVWMRNVDMLEERVTNPRFFEDPLFRNLVVWAHSETVSRLNLYRRADAQAAALSALLQRKR